MIQGNGFFQVRLATGDLAYTRDGSFQLDKDGNMVTFERRSPGAPNHHSARRAVDYHRAGRDGQLPAPRDRSSAQKAGQIQLAGFQNPAGLNSIGKNLYQTTDASGDPTVAAPGGQEGLGSLLQGYTEQSNVNIVEEFINLIVAQRAYEANSKVVKAADDMYQQVNNLRQ